MDDPNDALRVYISCAQTDGAFATDLKTSLSTCGFLARTSLDIHDQSASKADIEDRISNSDTVVFVLSPNALADDNARQELDDAYNMGKRIILTPIKPISADDAPAAMLQLPFVSFQADTSFASSLANLVELLKRDIQWLQEHTRMGHLAAKWKNHGKSRALLLFGKELDRASSWLANKPDNSANLTHLQEGYITASINALNAATTNQPVQSAPKFSVFAIAVLTCGLGFLGYQWQLTTKQAASLEELLYSAQLTNRHLESVQSRLYSDVRLAPSTNTNEILSHISGWFPRAASYAGSVARISLPTEHTEDKASENVKTRDFTGIILDGELLGQAYKNNTYVLTPTFDYALRNKDDDVLISNNFPSPRDYLREYVNFEQLADDDSERVMLAVVESKPHLNFQLELTALHEKKSINTHGIAWQSQLKKGDLPAFSLHEITSPLPSGGRALSFGDIDCPKPERIKSLGLEQEANLKKRFAPIGVFSLAAIDGDKKDLLSDGFATLDISTSTNEIGANYVTYERNQSYPETGSPIFNLVSGKMIALHIGPSPTIKDSFEGISLVGLLNEVRADLSSSASATNSVCETY